MRIMRSEDEKVIAAQANNSIFNESSDQNKFDYDPDFSFSEIRFRNEIARDRKYGTGNIKPINRNKSVVKERLYRDAIEEASRIRTGGYYNQLVQEENVYGIHDNVPGRLKEKVNNEKIAQINDVLNYNINQKFEKNDNVYKEMTFQKQQPQFEPQMLQNKNNNMVFEQQPLPRPVDNRVFEQQVHNINNVMFSPQQEINNNPIVMQQNQVNPSNMPYGRNQSNNVYDDIMNKVNEDIIKQNKSGSSTKVIDEGREVLRQTDNKKNNIPYKKTEIYEKGKSLDKKNPGLVIRDCKAERYKNGIDSNEKASPLSWVCSIIFMIVPIIGFIISGIVSLIVPKDNGLKNFARVCLTCHMLISLAATYLYLSGTVSFEVIKNYISRF